MQLGSGVDVCMRGAFDVCSTSKSLYSRQSRVLPNCHFTRPPNANQKRWQTQNKFAQAHKMTESNVNMYSPIHQCILTFTLTLSLGSLTAGFLFDFRSNALSWAHVGALQLNFAVTFARSPNRLGLCRSFERLKGTESTSNSVCLLRSIV